MVTGHIIEQPVTSHDTDEASRSAMWIMRADVDKRLMALFDKHIFLIHLHKSLSALLVVASCHWTVEATQKQFQVQHLYFLGRLL